ncbi:tyrosine--tRNA ligase, partial [candidate division WOR-3 bacterium]|nr:tyrosine--tRNA ligase [candidate division WOR-3 bacterium]
PDDLIEQYFELAACADEAKLRGVRSRLQSGENPRDLKAKMARMVVARYHSEDAARDAEAEFNKVFAKGGVPDEIPEIAVASGTKLVDVIADNDLASSKTDARRLIKQGAVSLDGEKVEDIEHTLSLDSPVVLRVGKRRFAKLLPRGPKIAL